MSHIYTVKLEDQRNIMHVEADSKGAARRFALQGVTVERLTGSQAVDLTRRGIAIVSAETGRVCNASEAEARANGNPPGPEAE